VTPTPPSSDAGVAPPALELALLVNMGLPPPWFVPIETPACHQALEVTATQTNDGVARRFCCDRPAGHGGRHRQVADNIAGRCLEWGPDQ
jgi:hypothetical protein